MKSKRLLCFLLTLAIVLTPIFALPSTAVARHLFDIGPVTVTLESPEDSIYLFMLTGLIIFEDGPYPDPIWNPDYSDYDPNTHSCNIVFTQTDGTGDGYFYYPSVGDYNAYAYNVFTVTEPGSFIFSMEIRDEINLGIDVVTGSITVNVISGVTNEAGSATITYEKQQSAYFDLNEIPGLFTINPNAGERTYTLEPGGTGEGFIDHTAGSEQLYITKAGTFKIGLETASNGGYTAGAKVVSTLTVNKGERTAPFVYATNVTSPDLDDGALSGLSANTAYEYRKDSESSYISATSDAIGEITGLSPGIYYVRFPENDLYNASPDSMWVTIRYDGEINDVINIAGSAEVTYAGITFDLNAITGLFTIDPNAGTRIYTIESGGTGSGSIIDNILTVTKAGTFNIGLITLPTTLYDFGEKVIAELTVNRGIISSIDESKIKIIQPLNNDGEIGGLIPNSEYEVRYSSNDTIYEALGNMTDSQGRLTGLSTGYYILRFMGSDLYTGSPTGTYTSIIQLFPPYTVTFDLNGATRTGGGDLVQKLRYGETAVEPIFEYPGYKFLGWSGDYTQSITKTVTAKWEAILYNIDFAGANWENAVARLAISPNIQSLRATVGTEVEFTAYAEKYGYVVNTSSSKLIYADKSEHQMSRSGNSSSSVTFTFIMPAQDVTVEINFSSSSGLNITITEQGTVPGDVKDIYDDLAVDEKGHITDTTVPAVIIVEPIDNNTSKLNDTERLILNHILMQRANGVSEAKIAESIKAFFGKEYLYLMYVNVGFSGSSINGVSAPLLGVGGIVDLTNMDLSNSPMQDEVFTIGVYEEPDVLVTIPLSLLDDALLLAISTDPGSVIFTREMLEAYQEKYGDVIEISIRTGSLIVELLVNGEVVDYYDPENPLIITIPFELPTGANIDDYAVVEIKESGNIIISDSIYIDGAFVFSTPRTGEYDVIYISSTSTPEPEPFIDTPSEIPAEDKISIISEENIPSPTQEALSEIAAEDMPMAVEGSSQEIPRNNPQTGDGIYAIYGLLILMAAGAVVFWKRKTI